MAAAESTASNGKAGDKTIQSVVVMVAMEGQSSQ
jgi:hypothetical protein